MFAGAQRMHSGGIAGNEVPAILKRGEIVIPEGLAGRGGSGVKVNIVNQHSGARVETQQREGPDGRKIIEAIVTETMNRKLPNFMQAQFGLRGRLQQR